jgi:hypothetical protein
MRRYLYRLIDGLIGLAVRSRRSKDLEIDHGAAPPTRDPATPELETAIEDDDRPFSAP